MIADDPDLPSPPRDLADQIVQERALSVPIDVRSLVQEYADIRDVVFPPGLGVDAVLWGLDGGSGRRRPLLLNKSNVAPVRERFTLAHELGHLAMAWHVGTLTCDTTARDTEPEAEATSLDVKTSAGVELEANRFASRLLIPTSFARTLNLDDPAEMFSRLETAGVSAEAGIYALAAHLPAGWVFIIERPRNVAEAVSLSFGTFPVGVYRGAPLPPSFASVCEATGVLRHKGARIRWARIAETAPLTVDHDEWEPILVRILSRATAGEVRGGSVWSSANAVAAAANSIFGHDDIERLAARIKQRFLNREGVLPTLASDPEFDDFASARARAFAIRPVKNKKK